MIRSRPAPFELTDKENFHAAANTPYKPTGSPLTNKPNVKKLLQNWKTPAVGTPVARSDHHKILTVKKGNALLGGKGNINNNANNINANAPILTTKKLKKSTTTSEGATPSLTVRPRTFLKDITNQTPGGPLGGNNGAKEDGLPGQKTATKKGGAVNNNNKTVARKKALLVAKTPFDAVAVSEKRVAVAKDVGGTMGETTTGVNLNKVLRRVRDPKAVSVDGAKEVKEVKKIKRKVMAPKVFPHTEDEVEYMPPRQEELPFYPGSDFDVTPLLTPAIRVPILGTRRPPPPPPSDHLHFVPEENERRKGPAFRYLTVQELAFPDSETQCLPDPDEDIEVPTFEMFQVD